MTGVRVVILLECTSLSPCVVREEIERSVDRGTVCGTGTFPVGDEVGRWVRDASRSAVEGGHAGIAVADEGQ